MTAFVERLREEARARYHDRHPFHVRMHEGKLSREELQRWVANRFCYQARIPIKDALIVAYCGGPSCGAYKKAIEAATKLGYTNIKHFSKGLSGWKEAGGTLETAAATM